MKLTGGIRLLREKMGVGDALRDRDSFDGVLKFFRNKGDPLVFNTVLQDPVPYYDEAEDVIGWSAATLHKSHIVFERNAWLARQGDIVPGIYYSLLGMKTMGYRFVAISPHLFAYSMHEALGIDRESVVKVQIFVTRVMAKSQVRDQE